MKKTLLAVALFIFCSVSYTKPPYEPPEFFTVELCMPVSLLLVTKHSEQVKNFFDRKEDLTMFVSYAFGVYDERCFGVVEKFGGISGEEFESHIKDSIEVLATTYKSFLQTIRNAKR